MSDYSLSNAIKLLRALGEPEEDGNGTVSEVTDFSPFATSYEEISETDALATSIRRRSTTSSHISGIDLDNEEFYDVEDRESLRWSKNMRPFLPSMETVEDSKTVTIINSNLRDMQPPDGLSLSHRETFLKASFVSNSSSTSVETQFSRDYSFPPPFGCPPITSSRTIFRSDSTANPSANLGNSALRIQSKPSPELTADAEHSGFNLKKTLRLLRSLDEDDIVSFKEKSSRSRGDHNLDGSHERHETYEKAQSESGLGFGEDSIERMVQKMTRESPSYDREPSIRTMERQAVNKMEEVDKKSVRKRDSVKENAKGDQRHSRRVQPETLDPQTAFLAFNKHVLELMTAIGEPEEVDECSVEVESELSADGEYARFRSEFHEYQQSGVESNKKNQNELYQRKG